MLEILKTISKIFKHMQTKEYHHILLDFYSYSTMSYIFMMLIGFVATCNLWKQIDKNKSYKEAGILSLPKGVEKMESYRSKLKKVDPLISTLIGHTKGKKPVYCEDSAKHILICGTTGSGKTVAISNYVKRATEKGYGLLIVDGKGDTNQNSIFEITQHFCSINNRKLYVINMNEPSKSDKYNPFKDSNDTVIKDMLVNMSDWSEEHYKSNAERYIQRLAKLMRLSEIDMTYSNLVMYMTSDKMTELSLRATKKGLQTKEDHEHNLELIKSSGKIAESAAARFATIQESEIGEIFAEDQNGIDIYEAISEGAVILFILNPLTYPETSKVMGRLALIDSKKAISKLFNQNEKRSFYILDELNVYASTVITDIINKSRSANITCIPAIQSLADLEQAVNESFKNQLIENCNNYIVLRQNSYKSAEEWSMTIGTTETMKMTYKVTDGEETGAGSARPTREFLVHPDEIKSLQTGQAVFLSRDTARLERINVYKPF